MNVSQRPRPATTAWNEHFWHACRDRELVAQRCLSTGRCWFPPGPVSPFTGRANWEWTRLAGRGRVWSWARMHQVYYEAFRDAVPYVVAQIELDEGLSMISNLQGVAEDAIRADMRVEVVFEDAGQGLWLPQFRPAGESTNPS